MYTFLFLFYAGGLFFRMYAAILKMNQGRLINDKLIEWNLHKILMSICLRINVESRTIDLWNAIYEQWRICVYQIKR